VNEGQDHDVAAVLGQGDPVPILVGEREVGRAQTGR